MPGKNQAAAATGLVIINTAGGGDRLELGLEQPEEALAESVERAGAELPGLTVRPVLTAGHWDPLAWVAHLPQVHRVGAPASTSCRSVGRRPLPGRSPPGRRGTLSPTPPTSGAPGGAGGAQAGQPAGAVHTPLQGDAVLPLFKRGVLLSSPGAAGASRLAIDQGEGDTAEVETMEHATYLTSLHSGPDMADQMADTILGFHEEGAGEEEEPREEIELPPSDPGSVRLPGVVLPEPTAAGLEDGGVSLHLLGP